MDRKQAMRIIQRDYETPEVKAFLQALPEQTRDIIHGRAIERRNWPSMEFTSHYSERQMRNILNAALDQFTAERSE